MESTNNNFSPFESISIKKFQNSKKVLFFFLFFLEIITNIDTGIFICSYKNGFKMSDISYSMIGSFSSLGRAFFPIFFTPIFIRKNRIKNYYITGIMIKSISYFFYYFIDSEIIFYSLRFISGGIQIFNMIFFPSWIIDNLKSNFLNYLSQIGKLMGITFGYYITIKEGNNSNEHYKNNFGFYGIILLFSSFILIIIPGKLFICQKTIYNKKKQSEKGELLSDFDNGVLNTNTLNQLRSSNKDDSDEEEDKIYNFSLEENNHKNIESIKKKWKFYISKMIFTPIFLFSCFSRIFYSNIFSVLLFWFNDYVYFFHVIPNFYSYLLFFIIIIVSPLFGLVLNNFIMNIIYKNQEKNKLIVIIIFSVTSVILSLIYNLINSFYSFIFLTWIFMFCLTFPLNSMIEFNLNSTYHIFKKEGFIISNLLINIFGNSLGIFFYGKMKNRINIFNYIIYTSLINMIFTISCVYFKWNGTQKNLYKQKQKTSQISQGTNYLRFSRTSELKEDINKFNEEINLPQLRISIDDNDIEDDEQINDNSHILNIKNFLKKDNQYKL